MLSAFELLTSSVITFARGAVGHRAIVHGESPTIPLVLYEYEGCPFSRRVRETLSALDLEAIIVPCPKGSANRTALMALGGKEQLPFLLDTQANLAMYESEDICAHLRSTYGGGEAPWQHEVLDRLPNLGSPAQSVRSDRGRIARGHARPERLLELWGYEASPYSRLVREVLCELELPYMLHNVARQSARRAAFAAMSGKMQVPYLKDANTGVAMFESAEIMAYLEKTYG